VTLEQLPTWVDSMSNKSAEITALANGALNRELERQSDVLRCSRPSARRCSTRSRRRARERFAIELQARDREGRAQHAALQEADRRGARRADGDVGRNGQTQRAQTFCWKKWSAQVFNAAQLRGEFQGEDQRQSAASSTPTLTGVNAKLNGFKTNYEAFGARSKMAGKAQSLYDGFRSVHRLPSTISTFSILRTLPRPKAPDLFDGPDWDFPDRCRRSR
jgi:hypothetical protein